MSNAFRWMMFCAALALGEACGFAAARFAELWPLAAALAASGALAALAFPSCAARASVVFLLGLALALSASSDCRRAMDIAPSAGGGPPVRELCVAGDVRCTVARDGLRWASFTGAARGLRTRVVLPLGADDAPPAVGEVWSCAGWIDHLDENGPSARHTLWVKGRGATARRVRPAAANSLSSRLRRLRADLSRRMGIGLADSGGSADLNRAILLGERARLPRGEKDAFVRAGTIHIFAISGLHVMLVAGALFILIQLTSCPVRFIGLILIPALWFYVALTGATPSAVRAAMMASFTHVAPLFWRRPDGLVAWSATFLAVYAADPAKLFDTGCALSFAVMLGLVLWGRFTREFIANRLVATLVMTAAAWAVGTPIAAHAFGRVTPAGLLANLALIPAAGVSVKASLAGLLASFVSDRLAAYANNLAALVTDAMSALSHGFAALPGANFEVDPWPVSVCVGWYVALALALWLLRSVLSRRRRTF